MKKILMFVFIYTIINQIFENDLFSQSFECMDCSYDSLQLTIMPNPKFKLDNIQYSVQLSINPCPVSGIKEISIDYIFVNDKDVNSPTADIIDRAMRKALGLSSEFFQIDNSIPYTVKVSRKSCWQKVISLGGGLMLRPCANSDCCSMEFIVHKDNNGVVILDNLGTQSTNNNTCFKYPDYNNIPTTCVKICSSPNSSYVEGSPVDIEVINECPENCYWTLQGNEIVTGKFLGTTNEQPLILKTNNEEQMRINGARNEQGQIETAPGSIVIKKSLKIEDNLIVENKICTKEVIVQTDPCTWPDYVFDNVYSLLPLNKLEQIIKDNKSLPGIPNAQEMNKSGHNIGELQIELLKKIEELTLYVIELDKQNQKLKKEIESLKSK